jgi:hypothetical protein
MAMVMAMDTAVEMSHSLIGSLFQHPVWQLEPIQQQHISMWLETLLNRILPPV